MDIKMSTETKVCVIGLGYVGLPLAVAFSKHFQTIGYDIDTNRIAELNRGFDRTNETSSEDILNQNNLIITSKSDILNSANVFIVTVPTPINADKTPNLTPLIKASELIGANMRKGTIVVFESTVYPGVTDDICIPIIEEISGLQANKEFTYGYSPERINPGDKINKLENIVKVVSGSNIETLDFLFDLYSKIIEVEVYKASSVKVAEAAKIIENTQRDINIALVNELSMIFQRLEIDTTEVLNAAATKWNFIKFTPGLVGGHCIGVDPYYLSYKAQQIGYNPEMILAGRRINDRMAMHVAESVLHEMLRRKIETASSKILVLGIAFKENCPDIRNTKVIDIIHYFQKLNLHVDVYDPVVDRAEIDKSYNISLVDEIMLDTYSAVILAVPHDEILKNGIDFIVKSGKKSCVFFDVKSAIPKKYGFDRL